MKDRRLGQFTITFDLIDRNPEIVREMMSDLIVVRAESMWHFRAIDYIAVGPPFEEVPEALRVPTYHAEIRQEPNGDVKFVGWRPAE